MSRDTGLRILNLQPSERIGHTEYCDHAPLIEHVTGINPESSGPAGSKEAKRKFYEWAGYDFLFLTDDMGDWSALGRATDMGHAVYRADGSDFRTELSCPFRSTEEVLSFDAPAEYGVPDAAEAAEYYRRTHQTRQSDFPGLVVPGGRYKTLISACIKSFGWEMFLAAVGEDPERFGEEVLGSFFRLSLAHVRAWAETGIKTFICHDDFVWANGPFINPDWYRRHVIPRYNLLWDELREKGIKVIFCSDGNFDEFVDDIARAGAGGFIFEPLTDFEKIASCYGKTHVIIGNVDCRVLARGNRRDIEKEVMRCLEPGLECPGFIIAAGNHLPPDIPIENALYYFELIRTRGAR